MPGIVGIITRLPRSSAEQRVGRMVEAVRHKQSYEKGTWSDESLGAYVGWVARKGSFSDGMPIKNETGDITLFFSGDDFSPSEAVQGLREHGHRFDLDGPSYLAHLYEEDPTFPAGLNGRFHGLVLDKSRGQAKLFVDRYGFHRLYIHESNDAVYFACEAKAILAVCPELRSLDTRSLGEYISCGCVLENRTLFSGMHVMPPASAWVCRKGILDQKVLYFDPAEWENQDTLDPEAYYGQLRDVFTRNLPRYFNGRERIGISLTGGLDTRMILAWRNATPGSLPCYTFGGVYRDCEDVKIARRVAQACGQTHEVIQTGDQFLSRFPEYAEQTVYLTDGCADVGSSPVLYSNERAAQIAPVRMTGNYGSEILRRLVAFKPVEPAVGLFDSDFIAYFAKARQTYQRLQEGHPLSFIAFRQIPWHHWGLLSLEQTQVSPRSPYLDNDLVRTAFRAPNTTLVKHAVLEQNDDCLRLIADGNPALSRIRTDRGLAGGSSTLLRIWLEVTFKAEYEFDHGMPQWLAKIDHLLSSFHLERIFLGRHKYYHFRVWYRDALSKYVREMLLDQRTLSRPYLQRRKVEKIVNGHLRGNQNHTSTIHKLLTLELLHRRLVDSQ